MVIISAKNVSRVFWNSAKAPAKTVKFDQPVDVFYLSAGYHHIFKEVNIQDVYPVKEDGDYTLTVCVAIYQFMPDKASVFRMDLPCLSNYSA